MRGDPLEARRGIVTARSIHLVQEVVGVQPGHARLEKIIEIFVRGVARGQRFLHVQRRAPCDQEEIQCGAQRLLRFRRIVSVLPFRIVANRVHHHFPPDAVAPSDLHGQAGHRHQRIHEIRIIFSPDKRMHAAHRRAKNEAQVIHAEALAEKLVVRGDHVVIVILGKMSV